jgi:uncharacterized protein (TIGR02996 family)
MGWADHVRDIRVDPDSDGPRLVAADWLLDKADLRGEYIVIACQLARLAPDSPEYDELVRRLNELAVMHQPAWVQPIVELGGQGYRQGDLPELTRGFVESITLVGRHAASFGAICALEPIIDVTFVSCGASNYEKVAAMPELCFIRDLTLRGAHVLGCEALIASPYLSSVRRLSLPHGNDPAQLAALASGTARPLGFTLHEDIPILMRLVANGFFTRITRLDLRGLTDDGAVALAEAAMPDLKALDLDGPALTERGMTAIAPYLRHLDRLHYTAIAPAPAAVPVLVNALAAGNLRSLVLGGFVCDPLAELIESPAFANVESLQLMWQVFTPRIAEALQATRYRGKLRSLRIRIDDGETPTGFTLDGVVVDDHDEPT